ncbi:MAG TPA: hypothetical protein VEQ40_10950, partial [Pyrinomonadaceae bacterium]|nr:hypothetical protein [Pyrinomonadaceae bacterium]
EAAALSDGSVVHGKRCGTSQNIGSLARLASVRNLQIDRGPNEAPFLSVSPNSSPTVLQTQKPASAAFAPL